MSTQTIEYAETRTTDDAGAAAHIVPVPPGETDETPQAYVLRARIEGFPVTALCGHTWVPQRDPGPLPVCSRCLELYESYDWKYGDRDRLPDA